MASSEFDLELIKAEGGLTAKRITEMVRLGRPLLEGSALSENREIGLDEVELVKTLLRTIAPPDSGNSKTHDHLLLTAKFARKIGQELNAKAGENLNPNEMEILGLLHDIGRLVTHRYFRNDLLGHLILRKLGLRKDLLDKMPSLSGYVGPKIYSGIDDLRTEQRIVDIADFCGKRKDDGEIRTFEEVMDYHQKSRSRYQDLTGLKAVWPTEKFAFGRMLPAGEDEGVIIRSGKIYTGIREWLITKSVDVEKIRQEILAEELR